MTLNLSDEPYVRLTTRTKDGRRKHTPVWIAECRDGIVGTTTDDDSWKVKRLRNGPTVELVPSDGKGNVSDSSQRLTGSAEIVLVSDQRFAELEAALLDKYGVQYRLFRFIRKLRRKTACGIAITLDEHSPATSSS